MLVLQPCNLSLSLFPPLSLTCSLFSKGHVFASPEEMTCWPSGDTRKSTRAIVEWLYVEHVQWRPKVFIHFFERSQLPSSSVHRYRQRRFRKLRMSRRSLSKWSDWISIGWKTQPEIPASVFAWFAFFTPSHNQNFPDYETYFTWKSVQFFVYHRSFSSLASKLTYWQGRESEHFSNSKNRFSTII